MNQSEMLSEMDLEEILNRANETRVLDLSGADISGDQPYFIADSIVARKQHNLLHLDLSLSKLHQKGFDAILFLAMDMKQLESLLARDVNLPKEAGNVLSKVLSSTGTLKILDIRNNNLGEVGITLLSSAFSMSSSGSSRKLLSILTLTVLDLSNNDMGDKGLLALCRGLSQLVKQCNHMKLPPALKVLRLNQNRITDNGAMCLAKLLVRGKINKEELRLQLDELALGHNGQIGGKGITALLGNSREGTILDVKRLLLTECSITGDIFDILATNIVYASATPGLVLETIDLSVTEGSAVKLIQDSARMESVSSRYGNSSSGEHLHGTLGHVLLKLSSALTTTHTSPPTSATANGKNSSQISPSSASAASATSSPKHRIQRVELGYLPRLLYDACTYAKDNNLRFQYEDTIQALHALNHCADIYGVPYIGNIPAWLEGRHYDDYVYYVNPSIAKSLQNNLAAGTIGVYGTGAAGTMPFPITASAPSPATSSFISNFVSRLNNGEYSSIAGGGGGSVTGGGQGGQVMTGYMSSNMSDAGSSIDTNEVSPTFMQQFKQRVHGGAFTAATTTNAAASAQAVPGMVGGDISLHQQHKPLLPGGSAQSTHENSPTNLLELKELEYLHMRKNHSFALQTLATEIQKLVEVTPTKEPLTTTESLDDNYQQQQQQLSDRLVIAAAGGSSSGGGAAANVLQNDVTIHHHTTSTTNISHHQLQQQVCQTHTSTTTSHPPAVSQQQQQQQHSNSSSSISMGGAIPVSAASVASASTMSVEGLTRANMASMQQLVHGGGQASSAVPTAHSTGGHAEHKAEPKSVTPPPLPPVHQAAPQTPPHIAAAVSQAFQAGVPASSATASQMSQFPPAAMTVQEIHPHLAPKQMSSYPPMMRWTKESDQMTDRGGGGGAPSTAPSSPLHPYHMYPPPPPHRSGGGGGGAYLPPSHGNSSVSTGYPHPTAAAPQMHTAAGVYLSAEDYFSLHQQVAVLQGHMKALDIRQSTYEHAVMSKLSDLEMRVERLEKGSAKASEMTAVNQKINETAELLRSEFEKIHNRHYDQIQVSLGDRILKGIKESLPPTVMDPYYQKETGNILLVKELTSRLEMLERAVSLEREASTRLITNAMQQSIQYQNPHLHHVGTAGGQQQQSSLLLASNATCVSNSLDLGQLARAGGGNGAGAGAVVANTTLMSVGGAEDRVRSDARQDLIQRLKQHQTQFGIPLPQNLQQPQPHNSHHRHHHQQMYDTDETSLQEEDVALIDHNLDAFDHRTASKPQQPRVSPPQRSAAKKQQPVSSDLPLFPSEQQQLDHHRRSLSHSAAMETRTPIPIKPAAAAAAAEAMAAARMAVTPMSMTAAGTSSGGGGVLPSRSSFRDQATVVSGEQRNLERKQSSKNVSIKPIDLPEYKPSDSLANLLPFQRSNSANRLTSGLAASTATTPNNRGVSAGNNGTLMQSTMSKHGKEQK